MIALRRVAHPPPPRPIGAGRPIYAMGDVHGCYDLFRALLAEIGRDAALRQPDRPALLVLCGDYVDRGPASAKVLAALAWLARSTAIEARMLEGNHEAMLRLFLDDPAEHGAWLGFGGRQTLESYGIDVPPAPVDAAALVQLRDALLDVMPISHHRLLMRLEPVVVIGSYIFAHAGVKPGVPIARQHRDDLLWIGAAFLDHPRPADGVVVHGHTWLDDQPTLLAHRMGIDTGAYETGVLTAVRLADDGVEVIQAVRDGG